MTHTTLRITLLLLCLTCVMGCSAWATYPPIPGAMQIGRPELEPVPSIMAEAIRFSNERYVEMDEPVFNLPEGTPDHVYESVRRRLRGGSVMRDADELAIHVQQVRVRTNQAQVDVLFPRDDGLHQLVTLHMRQKLFQVYEVQSTRLWRIHNDPPPPHFPVAEPSPAPVADQEPEPNADEPTDE
jgi:hypothetical protein